MAHPDAGKRLANKYELLHLAGEGGMAEVFRAVTHGAAGFQRPVAVKRVLEHLCDNPEFVSMFVEEARVVSELQHPNIVQIHDFDRDDAGSYFLVMEWIEGASLLDWSVGYERAGDKTPWPLVSAIGIEVLKALSAAHERRDSNDEKKPIFHRDVTPQNILMARTGIVKLSDFGLARAMDRARMTQPQMVKGKLSYLCPELTHGADPSPQTDIFGLGIVLWEVLTGRKLFVGDGPLQVLQAVREAKVPALSVERPDIPEALATAVHRALAQDPKKRYKSARSMVRALANLLRMTPESTSADVIAKSVDLARERSAKSGDADGQRKENTEMLDVSDMTPLHGNDSAADEPQHIPLTRKKKS